MVAWLVKQACGSTNDLQGIGADGSGDPRGRHGYLQLSRRAGTVASRTAIRPCSSILRSAMAPIPLLRKLLPACERGFSSPQRISPENFRSEPVRWSVEACLLRLRVDVIELHEPNPDVPIEETIGTMTAMVDAGKVRFIGVSNSPCLLQSRTRPCSESIQSAAKDCIRNTDVIDRKEINIT
jgi:hypothetical protein